MTRLIEINNILAKSINSLNIEPESILLTSNADKSISIKLLTSPLIQQKKSYTLIAKYISKTKEYILIDENFLNKYNKDNIFHTESVISEKGYTRLFIYNLDNKYMEEILVNIFNELIVYIISKSISDFFGCCSRYTECSNAKKCIHPDTIYSYSCLYKHNLDKGEIFYGDNNT